MQAALESTKRAAFTYMKIKETILMTGSVIIGAVLGGVIYDGLQRPLDDQQRQIRALEEQLAGQGKANDIIHGAFAEEHSWASGIDCAIVGELGVPVPPCDYVVQEELKRWRKIIEDAKQGVTPTPVPLPGNSPSS